MKREDVSKIFEGATEEQITAILDMNSRDIGKAKNGGEKLQADLGAANEALKKAQETISALESSKGDAEKLQQQLDAYKAADEQRKADEKAAAEKAELMERMSAVMGDRKLIHDRMRDLLAEDFKAALADKANRGKSDAEIFEALTRDQGYFASQNPAGINMPKPGDVGKFSDVTDKAAFLKLSGQDQAKFKAERPEMFYQIFPQFRKE